MARPQQAPPRSRSSNSREPQNDPRIDLEERLERRREREARRKRNNAIAVWLGVGVSLLIVVVMWIAWENWLADREREMKSTSTPAESR